jgi:TonB-linked SusC/RagA family outer membrane protein
MGSSTATDFNNDGTSSTGSQIGYVYRFGYGYDNKYLFEASGRYDGHYYFAPGKRWGYFPAFSAAWRISEEDFFKKTISFVNDLKIRGSWGKSGNLAGSPYQYLNGYNLYGNAYAFGLANMVQGSFVPREANLNITWEVAAKTDIGITGALWNNLLTFEADYFHERRTGMLLPPAVSVPLEYGLSLSQENAGIMESHGFEFALGSNYKLRNGIQLGINGNFSYATNKMLQIFETSSTLDNPNRSRTGRAYNVPFGYHALGLFTTADDKNGDGIINSADGYNVTQFGVLHPGDIKYADISGPDGKPDGKIDAYDETVIGRPVYPSISYGFTGSASWKGFDVSLFFQGSALMSFNINSTFQTLPFANNSSNTTTEYLDNRWTPTHPDAKYPRATQAPYANNTRNSDFWIINNGYLRLKTVLIGYSIPYSVINALHIQNVRLYVSGQNMLTFSKLKFMDPETGYDDRETAYPNQKVMTVGLNITF